MKASFADRKFQFWEYKVSHGSALVRSPKDSSNSENIDIIISGVEYIALPRHLDQLRLDDPDKIELAHLEKILEKSLVTRSVTVFLSKGQRFYTVSSGVVVRRSTSEIFDSPF